MFFLIKRKTGGENKRRNFVEVPAQLLSAHATNYYDC